jgi:hypothetical protein
MARSQKQIRTLWIPVMFLVVIGFCLVLKYFRITQQIEELTTTTSTVAQATAATIQPQNIDAESEILLSLSTTNTRNDEDTKIDVDKNSFVQTSMTDSTDISEQFQQKEQQQDSLQPQQQLQESRYTVASYQEAILPWTSWEKESASIGSRNCDNRPSHIPDRCCIGTASHDGKVAVDTRYCNKPQSVFDMVESHTKSYLDKNRVNMNTLYNDNKKSLPKQDCDLCRIVDYLFIYNWTMTIQGDSISQQSMAGMECELLRRGYNVTTQEHTFLRNNTRWRYGVRDITSYYISRLPSDQLTTVTSTTGSDNMVNNITIWYYHIYRPYYENTEIHDMIVQHSDIIVFDHGLHWMPLEYDAYEWEMTSLLNKYKNQQLKLVAWRETSSQHFDAPGGYFLNRPNFTNPDNSFNCTPINTRLAGTYHADIGLHFYDDYMKKAITANNMTYVDASDPNILLNIPIPTTNTNNNNNSNNSEVVVLPYRDYTFPLHDVHPHECTHYCHDPHVWLPIWRWLRIAFERTVAIENSKVIQSEYRLK